MDSLLANYASSDEEDNQPQQPQPQPQSKSKSKSVGTSLPPPSASLFSKLPQPKSQTSDPFSLNPKPKKVVQFRPPVVDHHDDEDEDEESDDKKQATKKDDYIPQAPSVKSFLSSIPAPRNSGSLGAGSSSAGAGRRSIFDADVPGAAKESVDNQVNNVSVESYIEEYRNVDYGGYDYSDNGGGYQNSEPGYGPASVAEEGGYSEYGQYESKWIDRSGGVGVPEIPVVQPKGKRGRNEIPAQVIEVNQDELMKNRPRPDQAKLTGIAFGPSYQPASSTKGKPSKLHKRKHQIGSLYFDMRSKEAELAERRSKGFLTKAETQAKYGW